MNEQEIKCEGCEKNVINKLACPKCYELNLEPSYFCDQICFKTNWLKHKTKHVYSPKRFVPNNISLPDYAINGIPISEEKVKNNSTITVLSESEIEKMRTVCKMARQVLDTASSYIQPGITTDEIDKIVHETTINMGAYPSPLNYYGFPKSVCTSVNEVICHGIPNNRKLRQGDIINIDVTLYYDGFHGDLNETYCVGEVDDNGKRLIESAKQCLEQAIAICKPGVRYREIGNVIQKIADKNGHTIVKSYGGHGIHKLFHCAPQIPHYANNKAIGIMRPGHVFTIEPMINEGDYKDKLLSDKWSVVTLDGKRSAQFEHTLLITESGVEVLTKK